MDANTLLKNTDGLSVIGGTIISNIYSIASEIRRGRRIAAIKELHSQTGWGLKEAKEYIDRYLPSTGRTKSIEELGRAADLFINHHKQENLIGKDDFSV